MTLFVVANYEPEMTERCEQRINAVLGRCGVLVEGQRFVEVSGAPAFPPPASVERRIKSVTDFDWTMHDDGTNTRLVICMGDDTERAERLASELRCCGMIASVVHEDPVPD